MERSRERNRKNPQLFGEGYVAKLNLNTIMRIIFVCSLCNGDIVCGIRALV